MLLHRTSQSVSVGLLMKVFLLLVSAGCPLGTDGASEVSRDTVNMTALLLDHILTCGSSAGLCMPNMAPFQIVPQTRRDCANWLDCSANCAIAGTCAPDAETAYVTVSCVTPTIYSFSTHAELRGYRMIAACGEISKQGSKVDKMCTELPDTNSSNMLDDIFRPVISSVSLVTYRNRYCAACNGEQELVPFDLEVDCDDLFDINSFSSLEDIWDTVKMHNCSISYIHPAAFTYGTRRCHYEDTVISHCNVSGLWPVYDPEIAWACENLNSYPYEDYKNMYCYICNPSLISTYETDMITSCNVTGQNVNTDKTVEEGCKSLPATSRTFPFKNIFCKLCNGITDQFSDRHFEDFDVSIIDFNSPLYKVYTSFSNLWFSSTITGNPNITDDKMNKTSDDESQNESLHASHIKQKKSLEELGKFCGYDHLCDRPYRKQNIPYTFSMCRFPCEEYSNCCEILSLGINPGTLLPDKMSFNFDQRKTDPMSAVYNSSGDVFPVIGQCPRDNDVSEVLQDKCEQEVPEDILASIPVTSSMDLADYKNVYCARCNNYYGTLTSQGFTVYCGQPLEATLAPTFKHIITVIRENKCNITVESPLSRCTINPSCVQTCQRTESEIHFSPEILYMCEQEHLAVSLFPAVKVNGTAYKNVFCVMCNTMWNVSLDYDLISECNVTGRWNWKGNKSFEDLCRTTKSHHAWYPFKNIFCAICNLVTSTVTSFGEIGQCEGLGCLLAHPAYRTIFSVPSSEDIHLEEIKYQDIGSVAFCAKGRMLVNNTCQVLIESTFNLGYQLIFGIRIISSSVEDTVFTVLNSIQEHIQYQLKGYRYGNIYTVSINISSSRQCMDMLKPKMAMLTRDDEEVQFLIEISLFLDTARNRSHLEDYLIESRNKQYNISVQNGFVIFESYPYHDSSECRDNLIIQQDKLCFLSDFGSKAENPYNFVKIPEIPEIVEFMYVDRLLSCVLQSLENYTYTVFETICSKGIPFKRVSDTNIHVCASDISRIQYQTENKVYNTLSLAHGIFSFVCTFFSLLGLILTFTTYALFKTIRNIPGVNNMNVVFNLFGAQLFTQFGLWQTGNHSRCILLGIITHYFWLGAFCAMNVCSFHMFRVFASPMYSSRNQSKWVILKYCIYVYVAPAFAILSYVLIKVSVDGSETLGYGGHVCFLSESVPTIVMFITPACLIIITDVIFFGLAYWHIRRTPHIQSNVERNDFKIYVKLLTVTGVAWPLLIIDALLPLSAFSFIATFANALQGVFIFAAFICNKKIAYLYKVRCCKWHYSRETQYTESSDHSKHTNKTTESSL